MIAPRLLAALALAAAVACEQAAPRPTPTPAAIEPPASPSASPSPASIDTRVPMGAEWDIWLPAGTTYEVDATWTKVVAIHSVLDGPYRYRLIAADAPDHRWRTPYEAPAGTQLRALSGGDAHWTFLQEWVAGGSAYVDAMYIDLATAAVERLGRTTIDQSTLGRIAPRSRPTVVSDFGFVAWTLIRIEAGAPVWDLFATEKHVRGAPVRLVRSSREPIALLATNGAIAFVVVRPDGDELWVHNTVTGWETVWARARRITAASWSDHGLVLATDDVTRGSVAVVDGNLVERTILSGAPCQNVAAFGPFVTWRCGQIGNDLRTYDLSASGFRLVGRSALALQYRVADKAFVWLERRGPRELVHLLALPL